MITGVKIVTMRIKILVVLSFIAFNSFAQQDAQFTQYMYNTVVVNPAYAGSRGAVSVFGLYRSQWIGLDGAPQTGAFSIHSPISNSRVGLGLSFVTDKIGPVEDNTISTEFSYTVPTSETWDLSFGIKASANFFNLDVSKLNPQSANDPSLINISNGFSPNIGAGIYWHSDKTYFGFSVPNFIENSKYSDNDVSVYQQRLNYYIMGGHVFSLSPTIDFKPAFLLKMVSGAPLQTDISANFLFNEKFTFGGAYRINAAVSAMAGVQITEGLFIGYGYDFDTTQLNNYNSGSHEIFLRFELFSSYNRIISPRFF